MGKKKVSKSSIPIGKAKGRIENSIRAYLQKEDGEYLVPKAGRIPLYLYGPPGIGKTAIAREVAKDLGIGFASFSLTHHTRNSLLGLPVISELAGSKYTEYTMSELIAAVYKQVQEGFEEGILLLDEFNCASETIMPAMLEFLQTGNIGTHRLPEGWILILCGNPPEYNKSARKFDAAVMDRVRRIEVEAEQQDFISYAKKIKLHPIICEFLELNPDLLYLVGEKKEEEESFGYLGNDGSQRGKEAEYEVVTPRGWENLSWALKAYEKAGINVDGALIREYIKSEKIADQFFRHYVLCKQNFSKKDAEKVLQGSDLAKCLNKMNSCSVGIQWWVTELLVRTLESELLKRELEEGDCEIISQKISNAIHFLEMMPSKEKLREGFLMKLNESDELLRVLFSVRNEDYIRLCGRSFGLFLPEGTTDVEDAPGPEGISEAG